MRCLLYCIFHGHKYHKPHTLPGFGDQLVSIVESNGLSASISRIARLDGTPDIPQLLAYQNVIESFHRLHTVIPMRYGCLFEEESRVIQHLEDRGQYYKALLKELEGCAEMGIRILLPMGPPQLASSPLTDSSIGRSVKANPYYVGAGVQPGQAYLAARKIHYEREARVGRDMTGVIEQFHAAFAGLFIKYKMEIPTYDLFHAAYRIQVLSLYFLVPRRCVEIFHTTFRRIKLTESAKLLLSGPWPPYNFVISC